jgi:hypothetical protein
MTHPVKNPKARICILRYPDETMVCANIEGFRTIGEWIAWLANSDPAESFHFHTLWHLESDASRFEGVLPRNVWFLSQSEMPAIPADAPANGRRREFEVTFQVVDEATLDELAASQSSGVIPPSFQKHEASIILECE